MPKKTLIIIGIGIALAGAAGAYWYWNGRTESGAPMNQNAVNQTNTNTPLPSNGDNTNTAGNVNVAVNTNTSGGVEQNEATVLRLARVFLERYGTFSNRNNFENITSLEPFMTQRFIKASAEYISEQQKTAGIPDEFYGITTTVGSMEIVEYTEGGTAKARVSARRLETKGTTTAEPFTQTALVHFKSVDGAWKVDTVVWE